MENVTARVLRTIVDVVKRRLAAGQFASTHEESAFSSIINSVTQCAVEQAQLAANCTNVTIDVPLEYGLRLDAKVISHFQASGFRIETKVEHCAYTVKPEW